MTSTHWNMMTRLRKQKLSNAHDILSAIEEEDEDLEGDINIFITPPDVTVDTDEDSADEDEGGTINNLNGHMLQAHATYAIGQHDSGDDTSDDDTDEAAVGTEKHVFAEKDVVVKKRVWKNSDLPQNNNLAKFICAMQTVVYHYPQHYDQPKSAVEIFKMFFHETLVKQIVRQSVIYSVQKGRPNFTFSDDDLYCFFGVLLVSGYAKLPRRHMYWEEQSDVKNDAISSAIRRKRFDEIMSNLHFQDNMELDKNDKMSKLRPLIDSLSKSYLQFAPWSNKSSIDEAMVEYFGRHSLKQCIRNKPVRFGFKSWCHNLDTGYLVQFEVYQGAKGKPNIYRAEHGLGGSVVLNFAENLPKEIDGSFISHQLFADNYFTSLKLCQVLTQHDIGITGTIRSNRVERCPLKNAKDMKKTERGTCDMRYDSSNPVLLCRWHDNSVVTLVSNCERARPMKQALRYSAVAKGKINISQPNLIHSYNKHMGGTDRMDQNINKYSTSIRSKKWWWPIFNWLLDATLQNAWQLYRLSPLAKTEPLDLLTFRRRVALSLLSQHGTTRMRSGPARPIHTLDIKYDNTGHLPARQAKRKRCAVCKSQTTMYCIKCKCALHDKCFAAYHTK